MVAKCPHAAELEALPGVGRKTPMSSSTPLSRTHHAVDTHIFRVANRTGIAPWKNVGVVEDKLLKARTMMSSSSTRTTGDPARALRVQAASLDWSAVADQRPVPVPAQTSMTGEVEKTTRAGPRALLQYFFTVLLVLQNEALWLENTLPGLRYRLGQVRQPSAP